MGPAVVAHTTIPMTSSRDLMSDSFEAVRTCSLCHDGHETFEYDDRIQETANIRKYRRDRLKVSKCEENNVVKTRHCMRTRIHTCET